MSSWSFGFVGGLLVVLGLPECVIFWFCPLDGRLDWLYCPRVGVYFVVVVCCFGRCC